MIMLLVVSCKTPDTFVKYGLLLLAVFLSGCIVIPTPEFDSGSARTNITENTPLQFEPGKTTRADIIAALGEPDAVSPDERILAYRSEKIRGWALVINDEGPVFKDLYLMAEFDDQGILQRFNYSSSWIGTVDPSKMLPTVTSVDAKAVRLQKPAVWLPGVDGYNGWRTFRNWLTGNAIFTEDQKAVHGRLLLTDIDMQFVTYKELANTDPELIIPLETISEVNVDTWGRLGRLVVRSCTDKVHSFEIQKGIYSDMESLQLFAEFLQNKITH